MSGELVARGAWLSDPTHSLVKAGLK